MWLKLWANRVHQNLFHAMLWRCGCSQSVRVDFHQPLLLACSRISFFLLAAKNFCDIERLLITNHVVICFGQFSCCRLDGYAAVFLGCFTLNVFMDLLVKAASKISGFHVGPAEILVAVFLGALAFLFIVRGPFALHAATVECNVKCRIGQKSVPCQNEPFFIRPKTKKGALAWNREMVPLIDVRASI